MAFTTITPSITAPISMAEYAKSYSETSRERVYVENMAKTSDLLAAFPIKPATAGKVEFQDISSIPASGFRNFNSPGIEGSGTYNLREEDTFPQDEFIKVDRALVDRLGMQHRYKQEELKMIGMAQFASQIIINGDASAVVSGQAKQPNGIKARCNVLNTNLMHNSVSSGGAALSLVNLDILYWMVNKPTHWIFPRQLMPYLDAAARNPSLTGQSIVYDNGTDEFGRRVMRLKGLPILFGYEPDDTADLLPMTEVGAGGGAAATGSIYCVSIGDGKLYLIEQTPLAVTDQGLIPGTTFYSTHVKRDWGIAREHPRAMARLTSVTASAIVA